MELVAAAILVVGGLAVLVGGRLASRAIALRERIATPPASATDVEPLPRLLEAYADSESELWAQEDVRRAMRETFRDSGKWDDAYNLILK